MKAFFSSKIGILTLFMISIVPVLTFFLYLFVQEYRIESNLGVTPASIVSRMTLEEKVGQLIHVGINGKSIDSLAVRDIQKFKAGGVILFTANLGNAEEIQDLNRKMQDLSLSSSGIPLFISIDQEGGRIARIPEESSPGAMAMGQTGKTEYAEDVGFLTGYQLRNLGFNLLFAPVLDVNNNPSNPVINTRSFGSSPELVAEMGLFHARGIRKSLIVPVIKHFPGHGDTDTDSHLALPQINKSLAELEKVELLPFRKSIEDGAEALMSAHILFPELDDTAPATLSPRILKGILREKLQYDGLIFTDAMEMHAISKRYKPEDSARKAFLAGADIILLTSTGPLPEKVFQSLLSGFQNGELSEDDLNRAVFRQISLKYRFGFFNRLSSKYSYENMNDYFRKREDLVEKTYEKIQKKYGDKELYRTVAEDSIRSLKKDYTIRSLDKNDIMFFYSSRVLKKHALCRDLKDQNVIALNADLLFKEATNKESGKTILVEINESNLAAWNKFVAKIHAYYKKYPENFPEIIALYNGNPFKKIEVPDKGAVFLSFSPTEESMNAMMDVFLEKKVVKKANLIFSDG